MNEVMKPLGSTMKERQGDWLVYYEVVGYKNGHNVWQVKAKRWSPSPTIASAIENIRRDIELQYTKQLRNLYCYYEG